MNGVRDRWFWLHRLLMFGMAGALTWTTPRAVAQTAPTMADVSPIGRPLRAIAERRFDRGAGLRSATAYAMDIDASGQLWLAAEDGVYVYAAGNWRREPLPAVVAEQQVRAIMFSSDGTRWMGTRRGVVRARAGMPLQHLTQADGLPGEVIYSLAETRALDGSLRVIAGTSGGVAWFDGTKFVALALPSRLSPLGMMVRATFDRDSVPELWAASALGGVARLKRGTWTIFGAAEGLTTPDAQFVLATTGMSSRLFVAGTEGVFALDSGETRFARLPGSPLRAFRIASARSGNGTPTLWVGTADGRMYEWEGGERWNAIPLSIAKRRGSITMLWASAPRGAPTSVYVSSRGGYLSRVSIGAAATLETTSDDVEDAVTGILAVRETGRHDELWLRTLRSGVKHVSAAGKVTRFDRSTGAPFDLAGQIAHVSTDGVLANDVVPTDTQVLVVARQGVFAYRGERFSPMQEGLDGRVVSRVRRIVTPDGRNVLMAGTDDGLFEWTGSRWTKSAIGGSGIVRSILDGGNRLYLGGAHAVRVVTAAGTVDERIPDVGLRSIGNGVVNAICRATVGGAPYLFAHDTERGVFWRAERTTGTPAAGWSLMPAHLLRSIGSLGSTSVECRGSEVLLPTLSGLLVVNVSNAAPDRWSVSAQLSQADGLPSSELSSVAFSSVPNVVWVGTSAGVGLVDLALNARRAPASLSVRVTAEGTSRDVADGLSLEQSENDVHVEPMLSTYHREEETRYRVRLHRQDGWFSRRGEIELAGADSANTAWLDVSNRYYLDLEAGKYELDVWAYDWAGREYGPIRRTFSVSAPAWRTWYALALYIVLAGLLTIAAFRWRVNVIRTNGLQLLESERRLRESERKFRSIFDRAMDAHLLVENGHVVTANAKAAELFGLSNPDLLQGREIADLLSISPNDARSTPPPQEFSVARGDTLVPVQCSVTTVPIEGSVLRHLVLRDLTSVRQAEAEKTWFESQVREAQKLESLGTLAGGVAHDFNNLLGVIRGNAELARSALRKNRSNEENLGAILDASDRARDVVRQILTFSRRSTPTREYVNLSRLVVDLQPLLRRMIPRTVSLVIEGADEQQLIMGDPTQLQQLLLNLVSNAEYAMRARTDGVLTIALTSRTIPTTAPEPHGDLVVLQVRDTGEGMTADVRNRIFEPFFTTKPTGEGTGLGMAVLHGIVVSHQGRADVTSEPGRGTTFELCFPRATIEGLWDDELDEDSEPADFDDHETGGDALLTSVAYGADEDDGYVDVLEQSPFAGACLVVVDDEPGVSRVVERALQHYGHVVHVFSQPELALAFIQSQPSAVDLLITDQTMPVMTGDMLAEAVHTLRPDMPVLILTGFSHRLTPERIAAARAQAVLLKPVALDDLRKAVDAALRQAATSS